MSPMMETINMVNVKQNINTFQIQYFLKLHVLFTRDEQHILNILLYKFVDIFA